MDSKRPFKAVFLTCLALFDVGLFAAAASAQMIYKQIDDDGKVIFTDQPRPSARTVAGYPTAKLGNRLDSDSEASQNVEPQRRQGSESLASRPESHSREGLAQRWIDPDQRLTESSFRPIIESARATSTFLPPETASSGTSPIARVQSRRYGEVERAVTSYTLLNTPLAAQVDANEAARRARQETNKIREAVPTLVVKAVGPDLGPVAQKKSLEFFYAMWVLTFILMAGGLLYFGWRVIELILSRAFPRWQAGVA